MNTKQVRPVMRGPLGRDCQYFVAHTSAAPGDFLRNADGTERLFTTERAALDALVATRLSEELQEARAFQLREIARALS